MVAVTPPSAARAAWILLVMPPDEANSIVPLANVAAIPKAWLSCPASKPSSLAAAAVEPNTPDIDVG
jgi:hypothetical protein